MDDEDDYCCSMRRHFLVGIVATRKDEPTPIEVVDFVVEWEPKMIIRIKYCSFCGDQLPHNALVRTQG